MPDSSEHLHSNKYMVGNVSNSFHGETPPTISINKRKSDASEHDDAEQESRIVVKPRLNMSAHQEDSDNGESAARLSPTAPASDPKDMIATSEALILITPDDTPLKSETETASEPSQMNGPSNNTPSLSPTCSAMEENPLSHHLYVAMADHTKETLITSPIQQDPKKITLLPEMYTPPAVEETTGSPIRIRIKTPERFKKSNATKKPLITFENLENESDVDDAEIDGETNSKPLPLKRPKLPEPSNILSALCSIFHHRPTRNGTELKLPSSSQHTTSFLHTRELRILNKSLVTPKPVLAVLYGPHPGKTTLVRKYLSDSDQIAKRYNNTVFWFSCWSYSSFLQSLRRVLNQMGLPLEGVVPEPMLCQKFRDWVNRTTNGKYLMIFDAVADMQLLETLFDGVSKFSGHLLLTMKSHEGVTAFSRKCGNGHTLLVPIGHMMEADLEGLFEKKGVTSKGRPIDFSAVNHVLEEAEGDALYSTLVKSYLDMEKCSCEVMVQRMLAVKAKLTKEFGERAASPMSTGDDKAEESKNEEDEDPLLYLLHLIIEALLSHFGALGQAAICILELMTFATTVNPVSSSSLIGGLKLEPDNPVIMNGLKLLHSKCLVRLELQRPGHDNAYRISHPLLHNALLKLATKTPLNQITTHMIQLLHDSATNSKSLLHSLNTVNQFLDSCQYLYQHLSYLPISSSVEGTTVLDPIHDTLLRLAILLFQNNQYREALAALNSLINLLGLKPTINVDKITAIADLAGCLATKCIHNHRGGLSKAKTNPLMALSRRNGAQSLHALASDTLETMVVPHLLNNHPETRDFTTSIQLVRAYLNLASIHGIQTIALLEVQAVGSSNSSSAQRNQCLEQARLFKEYTTCALTALNHLYCGRRRVDTLGVLVMLVAACIADGDQTAAWNALWQAFSFLKEVYGVDEGNCFDDDENVEEESVEGWAVNEILCCLMQNSMDALLLSTVKGTSVADKESQFGVSGAKRLCRRLLLGAAELRDLKLGVHFKAFVKIYKSG